MLEGCVRDSWWGCWGHWLSLLPGWIFTCSFSLLTLERKLLLIEVMCAFNLKASTSFILTYHKHPLRSNGLWVIYIGTHPQKRKQQQKRKHHINQSWREFVSTGTTCNLTFQGYSLNNVATDKSNIYQKWFYSYVSLKCILHYGFISDAMRWTHWTMIKDAFISVVSSLLLKCTVRYSVNNTNNAVSVLSYDVKYNVQRKSDNYFYC